MFKRVAFGAVILGVLFIGYSALSAGSQTVIITENVLTFAVGDVNGDKYPDIVAAVTDSPQTHNLKLFLNQSGSFYEATYSLVVTPLAPERKLPVIPHIIKLLDVNGDNILDIVVLDANKRAPHNLILLGSGNGVFAQSGNIIDEAFFSTPAMGISLQDINNDNKSELILLHPVKSLVFSVQNGVFTVNNNLSAPTVSPEPPTTAFNIDLNNNSISKTLKLENKKLLLTDAVDDKSVAAKIFSASSSVLSGSSLETPIWFYKVTGPDGADEVEANIDDVVYLELDATTPDYVWGNILVLYEADALQAVSIEENPDNYAGFWVWWTLGTGMASYGGGGDYSYYDEIAAQNIYSLGSAWADAWVAQAGGSGIYGPAGTVDPTYGQTLANKEALATRLGITTVDVEKLGAIRFYTSTYAGGLNGASPLRLGFKVLSASEHNFYTFADGGPYRPIRYDWNWSGELDSLYHCILTFLPFSRLNLTIYHGQGGSKVSEDDEDKNRPRGGAFTVANLNDTDGDGDTNNDGKVEDRDVTDNEVVKSDKDRDEIDLMQLDLFVNDPFPSTEGGDKVKLVVVGNARLWKYQTKKEEETAREWEYPNYPQALWVEVTQASTILRDISITLKYIHSAPSYEMNDVVLATGVWAEVIDPGNNMRHNFVKDPLAGWTDFTGPARSRFDEYDNFGLIPIPATGQSKIANVIGLQFTIYPANIAQEPNILFDTARQIEGSRWIQYTTDQGTEDMKLAALNPIDNFPGEDELPNDDGTQYGQTTVPTGNNHLYVVDAPGYGLTIATDKSNIFKMNAREFVRVSFNGIQPQGNQILGSSRCSDKFEWQIHHTLVDLDLDDWTSYWARSTGDDPEKPDENDIQRNNGNNILSKPAVPEPPKTKKDKK